MERLNKEDIVEGFAKSIPICIGYVPLGLACGILSQKAGLSTFQIGVLSCFLFAGSGQFITASMLIANASIISIIFTTFIVNLRHILMSSTLAPYFKDCNKKFLAFYSHQITDETFAINLLEFKKEKWSPKKAMVVNMISHLTWILSNVLGGITGTFISFDEVVINFVLTSMFICLLVLQVKDYMYVIAAIISGIIAVSLSLVMNNNLYVIIATISGATICYFIEKKIKNRGENSYE